MKINFCATWGSGVLECGHVDPNQSTGIPGSVSQIQIHAQSLLRLIDLLDYYIHEVRSHNAYVLNFHIQLIPFLP